MAEAMGGWEIGPDAMRHGLEFGELIGSTTWEALDYKFPKPEVPPADQEVQAESRGENMASIKERVLAVLRDRAGSHVTTADVAERARITPNSMEPHVRRVGDAVWVYDPDAQHAAATFVLVGHTAQGRQIVRDSDGTLWRLEPI